MRTSWRRSVATKRQQKKSEKQQRLSRKKIYHFRRVKMLILAIFLGGFGLFVTGISVGLKVGEYDEGYNDGRKHGRKEAIELFEEANNGNMD